MDVNREGAFHCSIDGSFRRGGGEEPTDIKFSQHPSTCCAGRVGVSVGSGGQQVQWGDHCAIQTRGDGSSDQAEPVQVVKRVAWGVPLKVE